MHGESPEWGGNSGEWENEARNKIGKQDDNAKSKTIILKIYALYQVNFLYKGVWISAKHILIFLFTTVPPTIWKN